MLIIHDNPWWFIYLFVVCLFTYLFIYLFINFFFAFTFCVLTSPIAGTKLHKRYLLQWKDVNWLLLSATEMNEWIWKNELMN